MYKVLMNDLNIEAIHDPIGYTITGIYCAEDRTYLHLGDRKVCTLREYGGSFIPHPELYIKLQAALHFQFIDAKQYNQLRKEWEDEEKQSKHLENVDEITRLMDINDITLDEIKERLNAR